MFAAVAITAVVCFVAGILFKKYVLMEVSATEAEAQLIKKHVTAEISALRTDVREFIQTGSKRVENLVEGVEKKL